MTLAAYPLVPKNEVGFRIQVTAANTQAEIDQLVDVLGKLANAFELQPCRTAGARGVSLLAAHRLARPASGSSTSPSAALLTAAYLWSRRR